MGLNFEFELGFNVDDLIIVACDYLLSWTNDEKSAVVPVAVQQLLQ